MMSTGEFGTTDELSLSTHVGPAGSIAEQVSRPYNGRRLPIAPFSLSQTCWHPV